MINIFSLVNTKYQYFYLKFFFINPILRIIISSFIPDMPSINLLSFYILFHICIVSLIFRIRISNFPSFTLSFMNQSISITISYLITILMNLNEVEYNNCFEMENILSMYLMHNDIQDYYRIYRIYLMVFLMIAMTL